MKVTIEKLDHFGRGIAYLDKICFVNDALPSEVVEINITNTKKNYYEATVKEYLKKSPNRINKPCPYTNICGGCNLEQLLYEEENNYKKEKVQEIISKFANIEKDLVKDIAFSNDYSYRNKITLHSSNNKIGYYESKSNKLIPIDKCLLVNNKINDLIKYLSNESSIKDITIRTSNDEEHVMLKLTGKLSNPNELLSMVDVLIINDKVLSNEKSIITNIGNKKYYLSIDSFFQVNSYLTESLYNEVLNVVKYSKPKKILDLYCGTGTIGIFISNGNEQIIGVDYSKSNIENANENKVLNNLTNIEFICNKVENVIEKFNDIDLIVVDPPRAGLDKITIDNIKRINPKDLVYVSCDPVTLARDLKELKETYEVKYIKPFNMFPRTYHVECVCVLKLR